MRKSVLFFLSAAMLLGCVKEAETVSSARNSVVLGAKGDDAASIRRHMKNLDGAELCNALLPLQSVEHLFSIYEDTAYGYTIPRIYYTNNLLYPSLGLSGADPLMIASAELWRRLSDYKYTDSELRLNEALSNQVDSTHNWNLDLKITATRSVCGTAFLSEATVDKIINLDAERENNRYNSVKNARTISSVRTSISCSSTLIGTQSVSTLCY